MSEVVNQHYYPRPRVRWLVSRMMMLGLIAAVVALIAELMLALILGPLLLGMAFFTAVLAMVLLQRTVLHPEIDVTADGLVLHPIIWPAQFVRWADLKGIVTHPLVFNDDAMGRLLHGRRYRRREGLVVVVKPEAGLWLVYRLIGGLAGAGNIPAFALSNTTQRDYDALIGSLRENANGLWTSELPAP